MLILSAIVKVQLVKYNIPMQRIILLTCLLSLQSCSSTKLYIGQEQGSLYTTQQLRREPRNAQQVTIEARIHKKLKNDFYLVKDSSGLILVRIKEKHFSEDTSYNRSTLFRLYGETNTETLHFYVEVEELEAIND